MKGLKTSLALVCAVFSLNAFAQTANDVANKFNEGGALMQKKDYAAAITAFEQAIEMGVVVGGDAMTNVQSAQKYLPQCHYMMGMAAARQKNWGAAISSLNKAAEQAELYGVMDILGRSKGMLGNVYMAYGGEAVNAKDWAKAITIFSEGYAANPRNSKLGLWLGKSYAENKQLDKSIEVYQKFIADEGKGARYAEAAAQAKSELSASLLFAAQELAAANNLDSVTNLTGIILSYDPANAAAHMMRLQTATNMKNYDAVIGFGEAAAEAQADDTQKSNAYFLLGAAYQNKEQKAKAIEMYRKVTAGDNVATAKKQIAALSK